MNLGKDFMVPLTQGDTISIEHDRARTKYEFVNETETNIVHLGLLESGMDEATLEGERVQIGVAQFEQKLRNADKVILEFTESKDLQTEPRKEELFV